MAALLGACGDGATTRASGWQAIRDTIGDTIVVRTTRGSVWGVDARLVEEVRIGQLEGPKEYTFGNVAGLAADDDESLYIVDTRPPALRKYADDGTFLATFGRDGKGPGEYAHVDGGVAVLPDGRVLLRDPGNSRITIYSSDGRHLGEWHIRGGTYTSRPLVVDTAGLVYHMSLDLVESGAKFRFVRFRADGSVFDTIPYPEFGYEEPTLEAVFGSKDNPSSSRRTVPFAPSEFWAISPLGYFVGGVSDRYTVHLLRPEGPLSIERIMEPVPVVPRERADTRERVTAMMRRIDPGWKWNGPSIPNTKPPYQTVWVDLDGRVWVQLHQPAERLPKEKSDPAAEENGGVPPERWREPVVFDVFESDGAYLGQILAPTGFQLSPQPIARGNHLWAVVHDELDVGYVVRFRIDRGTQTVVSKPESASDAT